MADRKPVVAFSPEDMKRRKSRALVMALVLVAIMAIFFVTTIYIMKHQHLELHHALSNCYHLYSMKNR